MVYSAVRERDRSRPKRPEQAVGALVSTRAVVSLDDRRYVLDGPRATIGRSKSVECVLRRPQRLPPPRRAAPRRVRRLADRRPRLDQRDQGQRPPRRLDPAHARATRSPSAPPPSASTSSSSGRCTVRCERVDYDPISVALKFGFLAVLYLFLLVVARSALQGPAADGVAGPGRDRVPFRAGLRRGGGAAADAWLVAERGGGLEARRAASTCSAASRSAAPRTPTCRSRTATPRASTPGSSRAATATSSRT